MDERRLKIVKKKVIFNTFEMRITQNTCIAECCKVPFVSRGPKLDDSWNVPEI